MDLTESAISAQLDRAELAFAAIEKELEAQIEKLAASLFNINSSPQPGQGAVCRELKLPGLSHTKTGFSTSTKRWKESSTAPDRRAVLRCGSCAGCGQLVERAAQVHSLGQPGSLAFHPAARSRASWSTPTRHGRVPAAPRDAQIPRPSSLRRAAAMSVDFNQLGLYVLAHLTKVPRPVEPLRQRADMHRLTAAGGAAKNRRGDLPRRAAAGKVGNFATLRRAGAERLALQLGITAAERRNTSPLRSPLRTGARFQDEQFASRRNRASSPPCRAGAGPSAASSRSTLSCAPTPNG